MTVETNSLRPEVGRSKVHEFLCQVKKRVLSALRQLPAKWDLVGFVDPDFQLPHCRCATHTIGVVSIFR
jgi:hypothetical protein